MNLSESKTPQGLNPQKVGIEKKKNYEYSV